MKRIALISCASTKLDHPAPAGELYTSTLFQLSLAFAKKAKPDVIYVLSSKYGLVPINRDIEPYDFTLNQLSAAQRRTWATAVLKQLAAVVDLKVDHFIILAGRYYRENLVPYMRSYEIPMEGLRIGEQLQFLQTVPASTINTCKDLHYLLRNLAVHSFPFAADEIPLKGIYLLFENGEQGHDGQRVVRIGSHTGSGKLHSRLREHFYKENKDRSIFRKNIGRALLNQVGDPFLSDWNLDLTSSEAKKKYSGRIDMNKQAAVERAVTSCIRSNFSFSVIPFEDKDSRLALEERIIATVSSCQECRPSSTWLGLHSPKRKIRESGLWQEQHLYKQPLSSEDLQSLTSQPPTSDRMKPGKSRSYVRINNVEIPTEEVPSLIRNHLRSYPDTFELEIAGSNLRKSYLQPDLLREFIKGVCRWGGYAGISARVLSYNSIESILVHLAYALGILAGDQPNVGLALAEVIKIKGLDISFGSKHLRFLRPDICPILDSKVSDVLGYPLKTEQYTRYSDDCLKVVKLLEAERIYNPMKRGGKWFASDIDMIVFSHINNL